jgi:hypothetical protein
LTTPAPFWYSRFRSAAYVGSIGSLVWTVAIVLPFAPFSYLPPIIVAGGPGTWFLLSYLLYLSITLGGFGALSFFLYVIEIHEKRTLNQTTTALGFALLNLGVVASCLLLAIAGALSGYGLTINKISETSAVNLLSSFVDPVTVAVLVSVAGAALVVLSMARAKVRAG